MPNSTVPYSPSVEVVESDEAETHAALVETLRGISETTAADYGHAVRSVHAKSHALIQGTLTIDENLPSTLAQGLFARAGRHPVIMRFSTSPGDLIDDRISTPRGLGIKIFDVEGERLPGGEGDCTQDLLMVDGPAFIAPDAKAFLKSLKMLAGTTDRAEGAKKILSAALRGAESVIEALGGKSGTIMATGGHPITNPLGETYYSQTAYRYGDYIAKFALAPISPELTALTKAHVDLDGDPNGLRTSDCAYFGTHGGVWELRVQLCTDLEKMPVEDTTIAWPEALSPYVTVGQITVDPQTAWSPDRSKIVDDNLAFSPWHGLAAHQPLGSVNRARKPAYELSSGFRGARNGCPIHEPRTAPPLTG
jgi:hypothetical protein